MSFLPHSFFTPQTDGSTRIILTEVFETLGDTSQIISWDDAWDVLDYLDVSYVDELPLLERIISNEDKSYTVRSFALDAIKKIDPSLKLVLSSIISLLDTDDFHLRNDALKQLLDNNVPYSSEIRLALFYALKKPSYSIWLQLKVIRKLAFKH